MALIAQRPWHFNEGHKEQREHLVQLAARVSTASPGESLVSLGSGSAMETYYKRGVRPQSHACVVPDRLWTFSLLEALILL